MATQSRYFVLSLAFVASVSLTNCNCSKTVLHHDPPATCAGDAGKACTIDSDCPDHFACDSNCCTFGPRTCAVDSDCCPGQACLASHRCFDQRQECPNGQSDCGDPGTDRVCVTYTNAQGVSDQVCSYAACSDTSPCGAGLNCFEGFCVAEPPCQGTCPSGTVCLPQTNSCWGYGSDHGCQGISCMPGYLSMLTIPTNIWDSCNLPEVACQCDQLPPLTSTDLGRYSSATTTSDGLIAVSMYDGQYGDLVVQYYTDAGVLQGSDYVDGVPSTGTVVAGPSGPRGGIADPGPDVGKYTSIVTAKDGSLFVSYYDVTNLALKVAIRSPEKALRTTQTVDTGGNVGLYTSIALDASGYPGIAYFQEAGTAHTLACPAGNAAQPGLTTGVKYAHAKSASPASATDWTIAWVDCAQAPEPPCYGCTSGQTCVGTGVCATAGTGCTGCSSSQVCGTVDGGAGPSCQTTYTSKPLADIPGGVGLWPSLAFSGSNAVIAYYDHNHAALKAATGTSTFTPVVMDGDGAGTGSADTGRYPSVAVDATSHTISIAYQNASTRALMYWSGTTLTTVPATPLGTSIIDSGTSTVATSQFYAAKDGPSFMGASANLHYTAGGKLLVSYQDSTAGDLEVAELGTGGWKVLKSVTTGSVGYFSHVVELPGTTQVYITHAQIHTKLQQNHPITDNTLHIDTVAP